MSHLREQQEHVYSGLALTELGRTREQLICFPEKSAQDQKKPNDFIKNRDCSVKGPGMCLPLGHELSVSAVCWSTLVPSTSMEVRGRNV